MDSHSLHNSQTLWPQKIHTNVQRTLIHNNTKYNCPSWELQKCKNLPKFNPAGCCIYSSYSTNSPNFSFSKHTISNSKYSNKIAINRYFTSWGKWLEMEDNSLLLTSIKNIVISIQNCLTSWGQLSCFSTIFSMKHHWTWKAYMKATTLCWKALRSWSPTYQPAVENVCKVVGTPTGFKCCISQNSLFLIIRFYAGKVKPIHISEEVHCSLPVSINFFFCKTHDFPVEDKVRIKRAGWSRKCRIGYKCNCSLEWFLTHLWLGSSIVQIEKT